MEKNIFIFGDSNVQGFWDSKGGWPTRLKQYFDKEMVDAEGFPSHEFYNMVFPLGVTDDTTKDILGRFEFETSKRIVWKTTEEIFIFAVGKNDIALLDLNETERNLRDIIKRVERFSNKISFLEVGPVDEILTQPVPWNDRFSYNNKKINDFNNLLNKIAKENNVKVISLYKDWKELNYKELLADGVHPNDKGHENIFFRVKEHIIKNYF